MRGYIKTVNEKAYAFVKCNGKDYFFHKNDFNGHWYDMVSDFKALKSGERIEVEFEIGESSKGPCAVNVSRIDWPNQAATEIDEQSFR